jgi:ribonucleoside-triphosphate reductase
MIESVRKRDGRTVPFDPERIVTAIQKALSEVGKPDRELARKLADRVVATLEARFGALFGPPHVEEIQDIVEEVLMGAGLPGAAKAYILYREQHRKIRELRELVDPRIVEQYLAEADWRVRENSNMTFSLQGLNVFLTEKIIGKYWLTQIYPSHIRNAHEEGDFHIHDLGTLGPYTYYGKEVVIAKVGGTLRLCSLEQLYEWAPGPESPLNASDGAYAKYPQDLYVLDRDGWVRVLRLVRKRKDRPMHFLKNRGGRSVIVTDNHPMITKDGEKEARDVTEEDYAYTVDIARLLRGEALFELEALDLLPLLWHEGWEERVYLDGLPLSEAEEGTMLSTLSSSFPRFVRLTEDFGYFVGMTLAEGYLSTDGKNSRTITIKQRERVPLLRANRGLLDNGISGILHRAGDSWELRVGNPFLRFLFERVFRIKPGARHKTIPVDILSYNQDFVQGLIGGLLDGDGSIDTCGTRLSLRVSSRTLVEQLAVVLELLGFVPRDRALEGQGTSHLFRGREIVQRYPLYGISQSKIACEISSDKYQATAVATKAWHDADRDAWHRIINNEVVETPDPDIYDITTESGTLVANGMWNHNCVGWDLEDLLLSGFRGVRGKIESKAPNHFRVALLQAANFLYTLQGEAAGAQALSDLDTLLAPFIAHDELSYPQVKQALQEFLFNLNVPTRVGFQSLAYDVPVVVRRNGEVLIERIGKLVEEEFGKNRDRVVPNVDGYGNPSPESLMVFPRDDYQALGFNERGELAWLRMRGVVKHRVHSSGFKRLRTGAGEVRVSPAHSLFRLNGRGPEPITPRELKTARPNQRLGARNHVLAARTLDGGVLGNAGRLDLVRLALELPPAVRRHFFVMPPQSSLETLKQKLGRLYGSVKQLVYEQGRLDKSAMYDLMRRGVVPLELWALWTEDFEEEVELHIKPYPERSYPRYIEGEILKNFVELTAWFVAEGKALGSSVVISQERGKEGRQKQALEGLGLPYREFKTKGRSSARREGTETAVVNLEVSGLYAYLLPYLAGASSSEKGVPSFIFDLSPALRRLFLETLIRGDGTFERSRKSLSSKSDKLITGVALIAVSLGYKVSLTRKDPRIGVNLLLMYPEPKKEPGASLGDLAAVPVYEVEDCQYEGEWEYDLSVEAETENFVGGPGLLLFHNTPFTNITLDLKVPEYMAKLPAIVGGKPGRATYGEFQREMDVFNRAFAEVMGEGDAKGRPHTFPIPTYNITEDFNWDNPELEPVWKMTARYGIPYFANFIGSDMRPEDARSMCCRLRLDVRELRYRGGGLFGSNPLTGSIGVVTLNLPRLGYLSRDESEFFGRLRELMQLAGRALIIKRKVLERLTEQGLYPYSRFYLRGIKEQTGEYWANHFSTIGIIGMNEACLNLLGCSIAEEEGREFSIRVLDFMRSALADFQEGTGHLWNLEATPAEGTSYRLAMLDKERYPRILVANEAEVQDGRAPYYTNSSQLPVNLSDDLFQALKLQEPLQTRYTGGTVFHIWLGERLPSGEAARLLVRKAAENFHIPYFTLTPTFSICPSHGYIPGEQATCPKCGEPAEVYSRVVGYLRPVEQWNAGKQAEFHDRRTFRTASTPVT